MKYFYFIEKGNKLGPFTFEELKYKRITTSTLVWTEGIEDWIRADKINDLKGILIPTPPPLPQEKSHITARKILAQSVQNKTTEKSKYDNTYKKEVDASYTGVFLLVIPFIANFLIDDALDNGDNLSYLGIAAIIFRVAIIYWVLNIAKRQNRDSTVWGGFALLLPSIALIIIGQLKKLKLVIKLDPNLPTQDQTAALFEKGENFFIEKRYKEVIEIINQVIQLDKLNYKSYKLRGESYLKIGLLNESKQDFDFLLKKEKFESEALFNLGKIENKKANKDVAIKYWKQAKDKGSKDAQDQLDMYYTFNEKYYLDYSENKRKLGDKKESQPVTYGVLRFLNGIEDIPEHLNKKVQLNLYINGFNIEFRNFLKSSYISIAFHEIIDCNYDETENILKINLIKNKKIVLKYNKREDPEKKFYMFLEHVKIK